jgi:hypothetical protein
MVAGQWSHDPRTWTIAPDMPFLAFTAAQIAVNRATKGNLSRAEEIEAFYVRQSDAELKLGGKTG